MRRRTCIFLVLGLLSVAGVVVAFNEWIDPPEKAVVIINTDREPLSDVVVSVAGKDYHLGRFEGGSKVVVSPGEGAVILRYRDRNGQPQQVNIATFDFSRSSESTTIEAELREGKVKRVKMTRSQSVLRFW
jgi:hypothetical protein